jgi:hypothetical protein
MTERGKGPLWVRFQRFGENEVNVRSWDLYDARSSPELS